MIYEPSETLHLLGASIDEMLRRAEAQALVHSIQIITADGESLNRPVSFLLSREPEKLVKCIKEFTQYDDESGTFKRSLASFDIETEPYLADDLISSTGKVVQPCSSPYRVITLGGWRYEGEGLDACSTTHVEWLSCLNRWFPGYGSTLWITQRCSASDFAPISSAFVLLSGRLDRTSHTEILFRISKLLRDVLVTQLVAAHREIIANQQRFQATLLRKVLSDSSSEMPLAPDVLEQMKTYSRALTSNIPILISGEAGTGKLAIAMHAHQKREEYLRAGTPLPSEHIENPITVMRASAFVGSADDIELSIRSVINGQEGPPSSRIPKSPIIVIDDIQVASPAAQDVLCRMLDEFIPGSSSVGPEILRGKFVFTSLPGLDALVACGAFSASLYSQISAFEIVCPPLRDRFFDDNDRRAVLTHALRAISAALELEPSVKLSDLTLDELDHIRCQTWPGNFRDLNNYLIRRLLYRN